MSLVAPIYTATALGHEIRFFSNLSGGTLPFHCVDDLLSASHLDPVQRQRKIESLQRDHRENLRSVATEKGIVVIASHMAALSFIEECPQEVEDAYADAMIEMVMMIARGLSVDLQIKYLLEALPDLGADLESTALVFCQMIIAGDLEDLLASDTFTQGQRDAIHLCQMLGEANPERLAELVSESVAIQRAENASSRPVTRSDRSKRKSPKPRGGGGIGSAPRGGAGGTSGSR